LLTCSTSSIGSGNTQRLSDLAAAGQRTGQAADNGRHEDEGEERRRE
jgi:hypothetical protein